MNIYLIRKDTDCCLCCSIKTYLSSACVPLVQTPGVMAEMKAPQSTVTGSTNWVSLQYAKHHWPACRSERPGPCDLVCHPFDDPLLLLVESKCFGHCKNPCHLHFLSDCQPGRWLSINHDERSLTNQMRLWYLHLQHPIVGSSVVHISIRGGSPSHSFLARDF